MSENTSNDMSKDDHHAADDATPLAKLLFGWTDAKSTVNILFVVIGVLGLGLLAVDFIHHRHTHYKAVAFSDAYLFYGIYGFGAFSLVVLSGWPLGKLLRRDEDYYGEADTTPSDVESDS